MTRVVTHISNDEEGVVTLVGADEDGKLHGLEDSDHDGWVDIRFDFILSSGFD